MSKRGMSSVRLIFLITKKRFFLSRASRLEERVLEDTSDKLVRTWFLKGPEQSIVLGRSEIGGCSEMWHFTQRRSLIWFGKRLSNGLMLTPRIRETQCSVCSAAYSLAKMGM
jgi:hypothetical protein